MKLFAGLEQIVKTDEPLAAYTWFGLGGPAQYFIEPTCVEQMAEVLKHCRENEVPVRILGAGANLLVDDSGVRGAVIHVTGEKFSEVTFTGELNTYKVLYADVFMVTKGALGKIEELCVR